MLDCQAGFVKAPYVKNNGSASINKVMNKK
jgi:hypothetical protein